MAAFDLSSSITSTSGISVSASGASAYTLSGNDRDGSVSIDYREFLLSLSNW